MRLYQSGALLTGARNELIRRGGVLVDGRRIVAAGPLDILLAEYPLPADVVDPGDVTLLPGLVDVHVLLSGLLPNGPLPSEPSSGLLPSEPSSGPLGREPFPSGPSPGAEPAVAGPAAAASALATPAGPSSR